MNQASDNPLHGANRVKLGVMAFNCSLGSTVTRDPPATMASSVKIGISLAVRELKNDFGAIRAFAQTADV